MQPHIITTENIAGQNYRDSHNPLHVDHPLHNELGTTNNLGVHHIRSGAASGSITFKPIEGKFMNENGQEFNHKNLYCKIKLGWHTGKTSVAQGEGIHPSWAGEEICLKVIDQEHAKLKVKDKTRHHLDQTLGTATIFLKDILVDGKVSKWIPIMNKDKVTGEVHMEMVFHPQTPGI